MNITMRTIRVGLIRLPPEEAMTMAVVVGACCCEAADATGGMRLRADVLRRIESGWGRLPSRIAIG